MYSIVDSIATTVEISIQLNLVIPFTGEQHSLLKHITIARMGSLCNEHMDIRYEKKCQYPMCQGFK